MSSKLQFPAGLRVVVVDDDPVCLMVLEQMLKRCEYEVTKCRDAEIALKLLRDNKGGFDLVISDVHMPGMDGFGLVQQIGLEMDLPVVMMSADDSTGVVMKGVNHGACHYLIKPFCMEELKNIWQHVVRKNKDKYLPLFQDCSSNSKKREEEDIDESKKRKEEEEDIDESRKPLSEDVVDCCNKSSKKRKDQEEEDDDDECRLKKKKARRVVWSVDLKQQFMSAVNQLGGIDKAVPNKIVDVMKVPGITRANVASHLQKYRLYLKKLSRTNSDNIDQQNSKIRFVDNKGKQVNLESKHPVSLNSYSPQPLNSYCYSQMGSRSQVLNEIGSLSLPSSCAPGMTSEIGGFVPSYDDVFNQGTTEDVPTIFQSDCWGVASSFQDDESNRAPVQNQYQGTTGLQSSFQASNVPETNLGNYSYSQMGSSSQQPLNETGSLSLPSSSMIMINNIGAFNSSETEGFVPSCYNVFNPGLQSSFQASEDLMSVVLFKPNQESPFAVAH